MLCGDEIDYTPTQWPPLNSRGSFYTFSGSNGAGTLILLAYQDVRNQSQQNLDVDDGISCCPADFTSQIGCHKLSWCHVFSLWCVMCHTWLRDGEMERLGELISRRDTGDRSEGERLAVCIRPDASNNGYMLSASQWSVLLSWMLYPGIESLQCPSTWITRVRVESLWPSFNASNASSFPPLAGIVVACPRVFA